MGHRTSGEVIRNFFSGFVICSLDNAAKKILPTSESFSIKVWKRQIFFPLSSLVLLKKLLWTARMQIWQPCRNVFYKSQKHFGSRSEFEKKAISFSKTCSSSKERFFGNAKCSFDISHETFWPQTLKYGSKSKMYRKKHVLWNFFFSKLSSGPIESSFDKRLFLLKVREWENRSPNLRKKILRMFFWSRFM